MIKAFAKQRALIYPNSNKLQGLAITGQSPAVVHAAITLKNTHKK